MRRLVEKREATPHPLSTRWKQLSLAIGLLATIALVLAIGFVKTGLLTRSAKDTRREQSVSPVERLASTGEALSLRDVPLQEPVDPPVPEHPAIHTEAKNGEQGLPPRVALESPPGRTSWQTLTVLEGQTLRELALEAYGRGDKAILAMLVEANPTIEDMNVVTVGQRITFPPLPSLLLERYESDDQVARRAPSSANTEQHAAPDRDIYDRIDQDILRPLKKRQPGAYRAFWAGLLYSEPGQTSKGPESLASKENAKSRISHFVQVASETESETASLNSKIGTLYPAALRAYSEFSSFDPSSYAPLLKDSVICRETWKGDADLIRTLEGTGEAEKEGERKRLLFVIDHPDARLRELHTLGHYALESGWLEGAIAAFDRIVAYKNPDYETYNNRAVAYLRKGEIERARNDLNRAIEKDPTRPEAFNNMGMTYVREKAYRDAATYFLHAAKVDPSFHVSLLNAAVVHGQHMKSSERATRLAREYLVRGGAFQRQMLIEWLGET
jgi:tetratricopeptide (TPR) repeat protein